MVIERALADADFGGDGVDADGADALQVEQPVGGLQDPLFHVEFFGCEHITPICLLLALTMGRRGLFSYTDLCNQVRNMSQIARVRVNKGEQQPCPC